MANKRERKLEVKITSDSNQFDRGFKAAQKSTRGFDAQMKAASKGGIRKFNSGMDISVSKLKGFIGLMAGGMITRTLFGWATGMRESANSLSESINAINVVFGDAADTIHRFGTTSATSVGLAQSAFNTAVVPIGSLLRNFGFSAENAADATLRLTNRAADLGSVFNEDVQAPLEAIASGLKGEANPMEKYGAGITAARVEQMLLTEGIVATKSAITDQDKVMGRYLLILEDTARVAGDFQNTITEDANATRVFEASVENLKARLGKAVIPMFKELVGIGNELLPTLETLGTTVVPMLASAFINFVEGVRFLAEGFANIMGPMSDLQAGLLGLEVALVALYAHPIIAGLALVAAAIGFIGANARENKAEVELLARELAELGEISTDTLAKIIGKIPEKDIERLQTLGLTLANVSDLLEEGTFEDTSRQGFWEMARDADMAAGNFNELWRSLVHLQNQYDDATEAAAGYRREAGRDYTEQLPRTGPQYERTAAAPDIVEDIEDEEKAVADLIKKYEDLDEEIAGLADTYSTQLQSAAQSWIDIFDEAPELETIGIDQIMANAETRIDQVDRFVAGLGRLQDEGLFALESDFRAQGPAAVADLEGFIADLDSGGAAAFELDELLSTSKDEIGRLADEMGQAFADEKAPLLVQAENFGAEFADAIAAGLDSRHISLIVSASARQRLSSGGGLAPDGAGGYAPGGTLTGYRPPTAFSSAVTGGGPRQGNTTNNVEVNIAVSSNADPQTIGRETARAVSKAVKKLDAGQRRPI